MSTPSSPITGWAAIAQRLVSQTGAILLQANDEIDDGTFGAAQWAKTGHQLANAALTAGAELAPQLMPFPCLSGSGQLELSDFIPVTADHQCDRELAVVRSFAHDGTPSCVIPNRFVKFLPEKLRVHAKGFRLAVSWPDLRSGTYRGRIRLTRIAAAAPHVSEMEVIVDL